MLASFGPALIVNGDNFTLVRDGLRVEANVGIAIYDSVKTISHMSEQEWKQLHVLIIGPHMPRENLVITQYFLRLLQERREGRHVVYAESLWDETRALDLLGTHLLDGSVGRRFLATTYACTRPAGRCRGTLPATSAAQLTYGPNG